ncbi:MAG: sugar O-acyltransferase [Planctomycetota bacterium]|nr:MAG: sugar O-acyltransferase [Planctomycetota bacterium]
MNKKLAIFGNSGFAYEVADIAHAMGISDIVLLSNEDESVESSNRLTILSEVKIDELVQEGYEFAIGIGDPLIRKKIYEKNNNLVYPNLLHPNATLGFEQKSHLDKSKGNLITSGVVFTNNIKMGNFGIYNLNCTIGHDCIIGDYVSLMPSVNISGNVQIEDNVFVGVGAIILQGSQDKKITLGNNSIVGAGALVTKNVEENVTVLGMPAKPMRK